MTPTSIKHVLGVLVLAVTGQALTAPCALADGGQAAILAIGAAASAEGGVQAVDTAARPEPEADDTKRPATMPIFFAPRSKRGAPALREGGASRGVHSQLVVRTLVPEFDDAAITLSEQPVLHWHISAATVHPVNFTLIDPGAIDPIVDVTLPGPFEAGLHTIDLADQDVTLEVGKHYEWYVAVVPDPARRSADTIARGKIVRIAEPDLLAQVSKVEGAGEAASMLASEGIWYDALESVRAQMDAQPGDPLAAAQWSALLEQVNIELTE